MAKRCTIEPSSDGVTIQLPFVHSDVFSTLMAIRDHDQLVASVLKLEWDQSSLTTARVVERLVAFELPEACTCQTDSHKGKAAKTVNTHEKKAAALLSRMMPAENDQDDAADDDEDEKLPSTEQFERDVREVEEVEAIVEGTEEVAVQGFVAQHTPQAAAHETAPETWLETLNTAAAALKERGCAPPNIDVAGDDVGAEREILLNAALHVHLEGEGSELARRTLSSAEASASSRRARGADVGTAGGSASVEQMGERALLAVLGTWADGATGTHFAHKFVRSNCKSTTLKNKTMSLLLVSDSVDADEASSSGRKPKSCWFVHWDDVSTLTCRRVRITKEFSRIVYAPPSAKVSLQSIEHEVVLASTTTEMVRLSQHSIAARTMPGEILRYKSYIEALQCGLELPYIC